MRMIAAHRGQIQILNPAEVVSPKRAGFTTALAALDEVAGPKSFARGVVHEILCEKGHGPPLFFATILACGASQDRAIVWSDADGLLYFRAISTAAIPTSRLLLL